LTELTWEDLRNRYEALLSAKLDMERMPAWLSEWSDLRATVWERWSVVKSAEGYDLRNDAAQRALREFIEGVQHPADLADQRLGQKLLAVPDWQPGEEHAQFVRGLRYADEIAGEENVRMATEIATLAGRHGEIGADMTVRLGGEELSGPEIDRLLQDPERAVRESVWRAQAEPWLARREQIDALALDLLRRRRALARNAGLPDYRAHAWRELGRLDYSPEDCLRLHDLVASHIVPLAAERYELRRTALGVETLRPWDLRIDPFATEPLQPFDGAASFAGGMAPVFRNRDPELGALFDRMRQGGYLDLGWRQGKRAGGVERPFPLSGLPFVSVCGDGSEINVGTLVHEMGHAYHDYLTMRHQRFEWQLRHTDEFSELAALGMWWLVEPYLAHDRGGFYSAAEARRNRLRLLEELAVQNIPRHARIDAFHHWLHAEAGDGLTPQEMDARWAELGARFEPWVDWCGLEAEEGLGWRQHWALFSGPFYEVAYILANLGALQIWRASQQDPEGAWQRYRAALTLGATRPLPDIYRAAGGELPFGEDAVARVTAFVAAELEELSAKR
jgi:oligoendopeptidase F